MKKPTNSATSLGEMVAAIELELAACEGALSRPCGTLEYWGAREAAHRRIVAIIQEHGGRARAIDRWDGARISFAGITVTCTAGLIQCARNWVRKARATMGETR
jgi:hypothetical protein